MTIFQYYSTKKLGGWGRIVCMFFLKKEREYLFTFIKHKPREGGPRSGYKKELKMVLKNPPTLALPKVIGVMFFQISEAVFQKWTFIFVHFRKSGVDF
jgi:hypothetical protein